MILKKDCRSRLYAATGSYDRWSTIGILSAKELVKYKRGFMNDIKWQYPYGGPPAPAKKKGNMGYTGLGRQGSSFADRFLGHPKENQRSGHPFASTDNGQRYHESGQVQYGDPPHFQSAQGQGEPYIQYQSPGGAGTIPPPHYSNSGYPGGNQYQTQWRFLDLKNRKQTGDLYKRILSENRKKTSKAFCFTASHSSEGVTTVLANLIAYIKGQGGGKRTVVIDANVANPGLGNIFGLPKNCPGVMDLLGNGINLQSVLQPVWPNIWVLCSGDPRQYGRKNFDPEDFSSVVKACQNFADFVFIDCPPVLSSSDALSVAPAADITFMVLQAEKVRRQVAEKSISVLHNNECELGGVILNRVRQVIPSWVYKYI